MTEYCGNKHKKKICELITFSFVWSKLKIKEVFQDMKNNLIRKKHYKGLSLTYSLQGYFSSPRSCTPFYTRWCKFCCRFRRLEGKFCTKKVKIKSWAGFLPIQYKTETEFRPGRAPMDFCILNTQCLTRPLPLGITVVRLFLLFSSITKIMRLFFICIISSYLCTREIEMRRWRDQEESRSA